MSQTEFASMVGVSQKTISNYEKDERSPDIPFILRVGTLFKISTAWLLTGEGPKSEGYASSFIKIPKVKARLSAGSGSLETTGETVSQYSFRSDWVYRKGDPKGMVLMDVFGDSMEPEIKEGDTVLIDENQKEIYAGRVYAVGLGEEVLIKALDKYPQYLILRSFNREYPPIEVDMRGDLGDELRIIGRVVWWCRDAR